ncbi:MAG: UpxY family transcription antiterminator [Bacteroidetes bacterium]|jgi:transcriptional antiterminator RfaH|nr:UpxY family transcription antiterminator [Bacteroidota bacterium]
MNWYAIYVKSRAEKKVAETLLSKQIEAYAPLIKTIKQWSDRKKMVELPLLNGYVFVKIDLKDKDKVAQTKGVVNFVRYCGEIAKIREQEMKQLKQLVDIRYHLEVSGCKTEYKEGNKVKITSGALKNIEGFVTENKEGRFIEVVLDSIDQVIKVKLPKELLIVI